MDLGDIEQALVDAGAEPNVAIEFRYDGLALAFVGVKRISDDIVHIELEED